LLNDSDVILYYIDSYIQGYEIVQMWEDEWNNFKDQIKYFLFKIIKFYLVINENIILHLLE
jgi:hypothetical protein